MTPKEYFVQLKTPAQRQYEALRAHYFDNQSVENIAKQFNFSPKYFNKLRQKFSSNLRQNLDPFFTFKKRGPQQRFTHRDTIELIISLRKKNYSIADIKSYLHVENITISLETIDNILKGEGFAPLPKRTRRERLAINLPGKFKAPRSACLQITNETFTTEMNAGPLLFLPLIEQLGLIDAIKQSGFPSTNTLSDVQSVLSVLALKLLGNKRWSHDTQWNLDRALGFFANLNVLPKSTTLSTYSYRITREMNKKFLSRLSHIFKQNEDELGEFNLDFKAIPHWGNESVLEKNWAGARSKVVKSILSLIVNSSSSQQLIYTDAEIKHSNQNDAVLDFVDFWKTGHGTSPKMLIFDSKFTTYANLNVLNKSDDPIKFLTLRRRGKNLIENLDKIQEDEWQRVKIERTKGKNQVVKIYDGLCKLPHYEGEVRQIIMTEHGREKPTFLITNDFDMDVKKLVRKYAKRNLVEQEISEQILFFHLNNPSSSIVVKVDFDLTLSLLAHNLYLLMAKNLPGFEQCNVDTIYRKFLENGAKVVIKDRHVRICLKKKTHLPILFEVPWLKTVSRLSWMGVGVEFEQGVVS